MALTIYQPDVRRVIGKLGRLDARIRVSTAWLPDYIELPVAPESIQRAEFESLVWGMLGNDTVGDCTFAGYVHVFMAAAAIAGFEISAPSAAVLVAAYLAFDHGVDQGANETTVLTTGIVTGICGLELAAAATGRGGVEEGCQIVNTFGASYDGVYLTESDMTQFQAGQPWHLTSDKTPIGGHAIVRVEYDKPTGMFKSVTWGVEHLVEFEWYEKRCDEQHAAIPAQLKAAGIIDGFDYAQMDDDLKAALEPVA